MIDNRNPANIRMLGTSEYIASPKANAAKGSEPDSNIEDMPESI